MGTYGLLVLWGAVAANLLIAAMFVARVIRPPWARVLGWAGTAMAIPLAAAAAIAATTRRDVWDVALPVVFVGFSVVEVLVDAVGGGRVKETRWLWPYLAAFYLAQWALIGAGFRVGAGAGAAVLATYFMCLGATAYSYREVGHGDLRAVDAPVPGAARVRRRLDGGPSTPRW